MSHAKEILIDDFSGGFSDDPRDQVKNQFVASGHFDLFSNPRRAIPYRSSEEDTNTNDIEQYEIETFWPSDVSGRLYGLGKQSSFERPKIFYKADGDQPSGVWTIPSTAEGGASLKRESFIEWGTTPALWMFSGSTNVSKWVVGTTFTDTVASVGETIVTVAQAIISPRDDNMYMFYNNKVVRVTVGASVTDDVVPLPEGYSITSAAIWGNFIAIAMVSYINKGGRGNSIVVLWDPTLSNFTDIINFGDGELRTLANLEGFLVGVVSVFMGNSLAVGGGKLAIRMSRGGPAWTEKEIKLTTTVSASQLQRTNIVKDFKINFVARIDWNGLTQLGLWTFGRKSPRHQWALTGSILEENLNINNGIQGFTNQGNYWWFTINSDGTIFKTNDQATFSFTSFIESQLYNGGNKRKRKKVVSVFATFEALPAAGQIVLKYRKDEESSYTTLFTVTEDNAVAFEQGHGAEVALPEFKEIQFRPESTGGAVLNSWGFRFHDLDTPIEDTQ